MDEGGEATLKDVEGGDEGELDHYIIGTIGGGIGEDEMKHGGDENVQEKEGPKDHCVFSVRLVDTYPPKVRPKTHELVTGMGEAACVQCPTRQQWLDVAAGDHFHDGASSGH
ncbi:hypothetical protein B296_00045824 [Ensete ventricosum]|uniref:Uncharacterized protein n=1 Tax=Ensete ventricosum TaxID=4639 RepID=A0A426X3J7_ENSVE|nr:hypothetical protein B296_00045824 [Ensete ventricosum]